VTSKFVGPVEDVMGKTKREVNLRKGTVQELLENTFKSYPKKKKLEYGGAFIRGVIAEHSEMQSPMLRKGDVL
jgi:molybdopterin converting factor small subunit